jgi:hypothetical protein
MGDGCGMVVNGVGCWFFCGGMTLVMLRCCVLCCCVAVVAGEAAVLRPCPGCRFKSRRLKFELG